MDTQIDEVADGIFRISTFVEDAGLPMNQYLIHGEEPLLLPHGPPSALPRRVPGGRLRDVPERLRWVSFGHFEADECGSMNQWLAAAPPNVHGEHRGASCRSTTWPTGHPSRSPKARCSTSAANGCAGSPHPARAPRLGGRVLFEETTGTLFAATFHQTGRRR